MLKVIRKKILLGGIDPTNAIYIYIHMAIYMIVSEQLLFEIFD